MSRASAPLAVAGAGADDAGVALSGPRCQVVRSLDVVGEKWSLLVVREAMKGRTRFSEFKTALNAPSDILTARLVKLVDAGVLEKRAYREPGSRERASYHLTEKGRGLSIVLAALVAWGDTFDPYPGGKASVVVDTERGEQVSLAFVDASGRMLDGSEVTLAPGPAAGPNWGPGAPA